MALTPRLADMNPCLCMPATAQGERTCSILTPRFRRLDQLLRDFDIVEAGTARGPRGLVAGRNARYRSGAEGNRASDFRNVLDVMLYGYWLGSARKATSFLISSGN